MNRSHRQLRQLRGKCPIPQDGGGSYQEVHHVGLVVPQRLHRVEDIHRPLVPEHLTHDADGAERPTAASPIPVGREIRWSHLPSRCLLPCCPSPGQQVTERASEARGTLPRGRFFQLKQMVLMSLRAGPTGHLTGGDHQVARSALLASPPPWII